jgi:hypothetical protein
MKFFLINCTLFPSFRNSCHLLYCNTDLPALTSQVLVLIILLSFIIINETNEIVTSEAIAHIQNSLHEKLYQNNCSIALLIYYWH